MYVYKITNKVNGKLYIGITSQSIDTRWKWHVRTAKEGSPRSISCAIRKYGEDAFFIEVIETVKSLEIAKDREVALIKEMNTFKTGYNMTIGGDYIWQDRTEEFKEYHKKRVREGMESRTPSQKADFAQKISDTWVNMDPEERAELEQKRRAGNEKFWSSLTKEERSKIANPNPRTRKYRLTNPEGVILIIENLTKFCRENDLSAPGLCACASGRYDKYQGWKCERLDD